MAENQDSTSALYDRFRNVVGRGGSQRHDEEAYFDEDDIIEIYDYANDHNDDFIKIEALFYGARMFPDSEALRIRRDYLYYYLGYDDAVRVMLERRTNPTTLSRLLALRSLTDRSQPTHKELSEILDAAESLDDEEVIQFVTEASTPENYQWLLANVERIRAKCSYLPTLYYELASAAENNSDYPTAIAMAEELTMLEPFNLDYWELLAEIQTVTGDFKSALSSLDYSLAIDPDSAKSKILKASALYQLDRDADTVIDLLMEVRKSDRFDATTLQTLVVLLTGANRLSDAVTVVEEFLAASPDDLLALDCLFLLRPDSVEEVLSAFSQRPVAAAMTETEWLGWAGRHMPFRRYGVAASILMKARELGRLDAGNLPLLIEALYLAGRYTDVLALTNEAGYTETTATPEVLMAAVMSCVRLGRVPQARVILSSYITVRSSLAQPEGPLDMVTLPELTRGLYNIGARAALINIANALDSPDVIPPDDYDPFAPLK
nr:tetratricopeptide repeat protein [Bacteroides sp.]